jgi:hypothetical protein
MILCFHLNCGFCGDRIPTRKSRQESDEIVNSVVLEMSVLMCWTKSVKGVVVKNGYKELTRSDSVSTQRLSTSHQLGTGSYQSSSKLPGVVERVGTVFGGASSFFGYARSLTSVWPSSLGRLTSASPKSIGEGRLRLQEALGGDFRPQMVGFVVIQAELVFGCAVGDYRIDYDFSGEAWSLGEVAGACDEL